MRRFGTSIVFSVVLPSTTIGYKTTSLLSSVRWLQYKTRRNKDCVGQMPLNSYFQNTCSVTYGDSLL
jgi:hypothetical protein